MTQSRQTQFSDAPEMRVPLDTVCFIISKAREFDVKTASSNSNAAGIEDDEIDAAVLEDRPADPVQDELLSYIADLTDGQQIDLVTLVWLGRDGTSMADWHEFQKIATQEHNDHTGEYLCGTPLLSDYLEAGLDLLGRDCSAYNEVNV